MHGCFLMVVNGKICFLCAVIVPADANQLNLYSLARNNYKKFQQSPYLQKRIDALNKTLL